MSLLEVNNLTIYYEKEQSVVKAVNGISFKLAEGETMGLVGETGAGKTTTALGMMNLVPNPPGKIKSGEVLVDGKNVLTMSKKELSRFHGNQAAMIFQDPMTSLNPIMTVGNQIAETIRHHEKLSRADAYKSAEKMLETVGIDSDRMSDYPHQFSGGMKQRVVIAIALACNPRLLLADEPTTALDVTIQAQILDLMNDLKKKYSMGMLMITHDLGVVAEMCQRVSIMYAGRLVESGDLEDVFDRPSHPYTRGLLSSLPSLNEDMERLRPIPGMMPDPANLPAGCPFCPRCEQRMEICQDTMPGNMEVSNGHFTMCHLYSSNKGGTT
ncbi:ABC transporter ATP-binding protein [Breznakiella homolactica]|uniref:ABC transporter ATP-binding protein n=1 Tax=Breznakiella homolactica TaxID=2798577 RepID=A0A7T7XM03_9SPIR|nr:ABC transporter ATP-binding protein [Breznakiella homolactica]QQO08834.1 ABC transporter ATP-binding protein [Breznakiella homolactica]